MAADELLRYGTWSGPGWTANIPADIFSSEGLARRLTDNDRKVDGIDRYDNFVAKSHDINEFEAQLQLRETLGSLELVSNEIVQTQGGREAYRIPLLFGKGSGDPRRFVSYKQYSDQLTAGGGSAAAWKRLQRAFVLYNAHIVHSNLQFAIDCLLNDVSRMRNVTRGAFRMGFQLLVAPHWFLGEAHMLDLATERMRFATGEDLASDAEILGYLDEHLVTPGRPYFTEVHDEPHVSVLTQQALISADREELKDLFPVILTAKNRRGRRRVAREFDRRRPGGCDSVDDAREILRLLD